ncbi:hypothetical protein II906_04215 [bacterium]|nr:hypothetical protein [bacterium]
MSCHEKITKDLSRAKKYFEDILSYTMCPYKLKDIISKDLEAINIIDVRDYDDFIEGHIPYAMHVPFDNMKEHISMLDKDKITVIYTHSDFCYRAYKAALMLLDEKYPCKVLKGGFKKWKKLDFEVIKTDSNDYE